MNSQESHMAAVAAEQAADWKANQKTPEDSQEMAALKPSEPKVELNIPRKELQDYAAKEAGVSKSKEISPDRKAKQEAAKEVARLAAIEDQKKKAEVKRKMRFSDPEHIKKMAEVFRRIKEHEIIPPEEGPIVLDVEKALSALITAKSPDKNDSAAEMPSYTLVSAAEKMVGGLETDEPQRPAEENAPVRIRRSRPTVEGGRARSSAA